MREVYKEYLWKVPICVLELSTHKPVVHVDGNVVVGTLGAVLAPRNLARTFFLCFISPSNTSDCGEVCEEREPRRAHIRIYGVGIGFL